MMPSRCPSPIELSRALASGIDAPLQAHLDTCARCTAELASHDDVADIAAQLPIVDPHPDHARLVRAALVTAARGPATAAPRRLWLFGVGAATALAAAAILLVVIRQPASRPTQVAYRGAIHAHDDARFARVGGAPDEIVRLTHGTITVEVAPLATGERFRVITADSEVEVRGTAFDVTAEDDRLAAVRVLHGQVEVRASGAAPKLLAAGERWEMKLAMLEDAASGDLASAGAAANVAAPGVAAPGEPTSDKPTFGKPTSGKPTSGKPTSDKVATGKPTSNKPVSASVAAITNDVSKSPIAATSAPRRPIEILFEQGWAALAAGNPRDAATSFERAATSAPNDPLAEDAWFWRASALARAKSGATTGALEQFLARYPRSNRAGEASAVLGWLVIANNLDRAEKLFRAAAKDRVPAVRTSGEKGLAAVAKQRGE